MSGQFGTIEFDNIKISIDTSEGTGFIRSNLREDTESALDRDDLMSMQMWNLWVDGLESLILAHACAGVDVFSNQYVEGLRSAYEAYENHQS
jgi:hypothetical protein